jgi:predicted KAP-like P-loop ATPase
MHFVRHKWKWMLWFALGGATGTYLPLASLPAKLSLWLRWVASYPYPLHLPLIALLFLICLERASRVVKRYRNNLASGQSPFTAIEASLGFVFGLVFALALSRSLTDCWASLILQARAVTLTWAAAFVLFVLTAVLKARPKSAESPPQQADATRMTDAPIATDEEDTLGRVPFVNDFHREIKKFPFDEPVVFGLNGQWGSGKTSVLNLLRNRLRHDKDIILVDFNPWYFSSADVLVHRFYSAVAAAINREFFFPDLLGLARRYSAILSPVLKRYGADIDMRNSSVEDVKQQVERYILQTNRRVIVLIDDIDRADDDGLLGVFRTVRLTGEFKKTTFVLAYDDDQVCAHLKRLNIPPEYLEKIVQNPIQIPALDQGDIDRFLLYSDAQHRSQIDILFDKIGIGKEERAEFDKKIVEIYPPQLRRFFQTLRSAKRFLNSLSTRLPVVRDEVYLLDFVLLEVLRVFAPRVYDDIYENRYYYIPAWTFEEILASPFGIVGRREQEEVSKRIKVHVDDLLSGESRRDNIRAILEELFFQLKSDRASPTSDSYAAKVRAKKRLTHPDSFQKYFLLSVPREAIPDKVVEETMKSWAASPNPQSLMTKDLLAYQKRGNLRKFMDALALFLDKMDERTAGELLTVISSRVQTFSREGRESSEHDGAFKLALFVLSERIKDSDRRERFEQTLRETPALEFAIRILNAVAQAQSGIHALQQAADLTAAREIVSQRVRQEVVDADVDLIEMNREWGFILFQTGLYSEESRKMINDYALKLCEKNPSYIGKLVGGFRLDLGETGSFNLTELRRVYDSRALAVLARAAGKTAWITSNEQLAVEQLLVAEADPGPQTSDSSTSNS